MTRRRGQLAALAAVIALGGVLGCGSDDEQPARGVPRATAEALERELDLVDARLEVTRQQGAIGACNDIDSKSYPDIERLVQGLPEDTDADVRRALEQSIDRLRELTESECSELAEKIEQRREETTPTVTTPPPPPAPTQTTPQQTTPEEGPDDKPKDEEKKPEKQKEGKGQSPQDMNDPGTGGGGQPAPPPQDG